MYNFGLHEHINKLLKEAGFDLGGKDNLFYTRFMANAASIFELYMQLYEHHPKGETGFDELIATIIKAYNERSAALKDSDMKKLQEDHWFLSNRMAGMSLYVDRFCGTLQNLPSKFDYLENLGINFLHLMPLFESPANESDGGYAVSDFRKIDKRFGDIKDLQQVQNSMRKRNMYLMLDIVLNHTSHHHKWAKKAKNGEKQYQDYYYLYNDRSIPDQYDNTMPEIFPESSPGSFTYSVEMKKWVMTVFHNYQWDLNYTNPMVLVEMMDTIFFYANLGVDILRIDAPAFIWKKLGTSCQNLAEAHTLLQLIKQCVQVATPGMALLGEAIVAPAEIIKYFGTGANTAKECDFAYNATHMALQWDMLATGDTRVMLVAQEDILKKPVGTSWITYTRCHDDIGLGYDDAMIAAVGYDPYEHRKFLKEYYSGVLPDSSAKGALFSVNPKTQDARISGSLASLCGLEKALEKEDRSAITISIKKILLMQAHSFFIGGTPMLFYGDEVGYINDYSYLDDTGKSYDNRWLHRPLINWEKNNLVLVKDTIEEQIYSSTKQLLSIRKRLPVITDRSNLTWITPHNIHIAQYLRKWENDQFYGVFNFSTRPAYLTWFAFKEQPPAAKLLFDHWRQKEYLVGEDNEFLVVQPYEFYLFEVKKTV